MRVAAIIVAAILIGVAAGWLSVPRATVPADQARMAIEAAAGPQATTHTGLTGAARDGFTQHFVMSCAAAAARTGRSAAVIESYCQCTAEKAADMLTVDEVFAIYKNSADNLAFEQRLTPVEKECAAAALQ